MKTAAEYMNEMMIISKAFDSINGNREKAFELLSNYSETNKENLKECYESNDEFKFNAFCRVKEDVIAKLRKLHFSAIYDWRKK